MDKDMIIESLMKQVADLTALVQTLTESNAALNETIKELQETIRELQRQLNQNSQNSSKPPSSDGFNKPNPQSQRQKSGKKQGAQKGHPGSHMVIPHEPDECSKHFPQKCLSCSHLNECVMSGKVFTCGERRYEVNAVITTKVTEHQSIHVAACPCTGGPLSGEFPEGIRAYVQYGDSVCTGRSVEHLWRRQHNADPCPSWKPARCQSVHRNDHIYGVEVRPKGR